MSGFRDSRVDEYRQEVPDPATRCRQIRTKMMFVATDWEERAAEYPSSTATYWCLKTMAVVGPDGEPVDIGDCRAGRSCHEPE